MIDRFGRFSLTIFEISKYWHKIASDALAVYGLKSSHALYLTTIYKHTDGITMPQLCEECGKDKSDASRMVSILEKKGFVKKQEVNGSRYRGVLVLTDEGKAIAQQVSDLAAHIVEATSKDLTEEMRNSLYKSLDSIIVNLRQISKEPFYYETADWSDIR